jgi:hypothetical protein
MAETPVPQAETPRSDAERTADALQTWGAIARAGGVLLGVVGLMCSIPLAVNSEWVRSACLVAGAVVLIAASFWMYLWHDVAAQVLLQLDAMRGESAGPSRGADVQKGGSGEKRDEQG